MSADVVTPACTLAASNNASAASRWGADGGSGGAGSLGPVGATGLGPVGLVGGRVDVGVAVVLEDAEEPVQPDVDRGRLQHARIPGLHGDPAGVDVGQDVAVTHQHGS